MYPTESEPCEAKLQSQRDPDHTIQGVGPDGVFCCPECGTRLRLEAGSEFEGEGRATLPGIPSSSAMTETRSAETPVALQRELPLAYTAEYLGIRPSQPVELPSLIEDPAELAPADTDEPTRVTRTNGLPVLPPPPPIVPEEIARRASLGLPLPVLPPPPAAASDTSISEASETSTTSSEASTASETSTTSSEASTASETDSEMEDIDALLASQPSPSVNTRARQETLPYESEPAPHEMQTSAAATSEGNAGPSPTATPVEKRPKHPLPVPHPVWVNVAQRRDATATPIVNMSPDDMADSQIAPSVQPTTAYPEEEQQPVPALPLATAQAIQEIANAPTLPEAQDIPTRPEVQVTPAPQDQVALEVQPPPSQTEALSPPAAAETQAARTVTESAPTAAVDPVADQQRARPLFSDAPLTSDAAPAAPRKRSSRALWLSLLVIGAGALVLQQRIKSSETALSLPASPVVSVVLAAQPAPPNEVVPPAPESSAMVEDVAIAKSADPEVKAARLATPKTVRGSTRDPERDSARDPERDSAKVSSKGSSKEAAASEKTDAEKTADEPTFDADAAAEALESAATSASSCRQASDPSGVAVVTITFAPSGRVTTANISGPPFVGTATGSCIAATLRRAKVPPFKGKLVTVRKTVTIH